jgi:hypothetical protein
VPGPSHDDWGPGGDGRHYLPLDDDELTEDEADYLVRPYAVTGGRTEPRSRLEIEAMVTAAHYGARDLSVLSPECQAILNVCRDWRSVAEVSAVLQMPLG